MPIDYKKKYEIARDEVSGERGFAKCITEELTRNRKALDVLLTLVDEDKLIDALTELHNLRVLLRKAIQTGPNQKSGEPTEIKVKRKYRKRKKRASK